MNSLHDDQTAVLRRAIYGILIAAAVANMTGRIFAVRSEMGKTPLLSANDRSRWCTIRSLVDHGTYEIDEILFLPDGRRNREWYSIDMVYHRGRDGKLHYYSSKPPLLPTLLAGQYWLLKKVGGLNLRDHPFYVARTMLVATNVLPMALLLILIARGAERFGTTDFGRIFVVAAAAWGTMLTTFAVTLNNHSVAAVSAAVTLHCLWRIVCDHEWRLRYYAIAGFAAAFTAANELPALALLVFVGGWLLRHSARQTLLAFVPSAGLVAAAFFLTNYWAHDSWRPPYAHRDDGTQVAQLATTDPDVAVAELVQAKVLSSPDVELAATREDQRWVCIDRQAQRRFTLLRSDSGMDVYESDNWYEYPGTYWSQERKEGVDRGEASPLTYAFHVLIGHHGIFSLTPVWLLAVVGCGMAFRRPQEAFRVLALIAALSVICLLFYLTRPQMDRNYGGNTCAFRWMLWFAPLWLFCMIPAADWVAGQRWRRRVAVLLLLGSVLSASYAGLNPWSPPWLFNYWTYMGWIHY